MTEEKEKKMAALEAEHKTTMEAKEGLEEEHKKTVEEKEGLLKEKATLEKR